MRPTRTLSAAAGAAALFMAVGASPAAFACPGQEPCRIGEGSYRLRLPAGWDGRSPLPVLVFLHGYRGSADEVAGDTMLLEELDRRGTALLAPQGADAERRGASWSFPGKAETGRDDIAFVEAVVADAARHIPIDRSRLVASGFSVGGSMVWYVACQGHNVFSAYVPVAGAFWMPEPEDCPAGPQVLRHVHGLADPTVPMKGRAVGGAGRSYRQGDVMHGFATWKTVNGCPSEPSRRQEVAGLSCETWDASACRSGRPLMLCLHPGEHEIEARWVGEGLDWAFR
jgi:polyhydroxybutyrate depolymerase